MDNKNYKIKCETGFYNIKIGTLRWKHKNGFGKLLAKGLNKPFKESLSPKLPEGVNEIWWVDKAKGMWHQIVRDLKTGDIIHNDHQLLKDKNNLK